MDASSSKVTVEYHDLAGFFPLISDDLAARLPLHNLEWHSPPRPPRQIRSLHLEFVPDVSTQNYLRPPIQPSDSHGPATSLDIVRSGRAARKDASKERRHQIPGLKTSPYLKIYVLRCDDKDKYKQTERKNLREWMKENVQAGSKRSENHDAFEWMILHVVLPGTVSASEPRWRDISSSNEIDDFEERPKNASKWPGKSGRTVFDRLRADFGDSGKNGLDRIAQVRLRKADVPSDLLPTPAIIPPMDESQQDHDNAWNDLMSKIRAFILGPFDLRVRQYEADIAAQEARRSLPGWNFCTFFIHKEGLAKALESVGLVADALVIYDELALGLETSVRDVVSGRSEGTATSFAPHSDDLESQILGCGAAISNGTPAEDWSGGTTEKGSNAFLGLFAKDYRQLILTSSISVFDFFSYLFVRQKNLILRLANTVGARAELSSAGDTDGGEDLVLTSEVCWRASSFMHNNGRTLRLDLASWRESHDSGQGSLDIEDLVRCWTYLVAEEVLRETSAPALDEIMTEAKTKPQNGTSPGPAVSGFATEPDLQPERTSSMATKASPSRISRPDTSTAEVGPSSDLNGAAVIDFTQTLGLPGQAELATYRAELILMQRKMLQGLAASRGWSVGWAVMKHEELSGIVHTRHAKEAGDRSDNERWSSTARLASIKHPVLAAALSSEAAFHMRYELLCQQAIRHYALATQTKSVDAILVDLALLRYQQGDLESAETYFRHVLPSFTSDDWSLAEVQMHTAYSHCLKALGKMDEYVHCLLDRLAKTCRRAMSQCLSHRPFAMEKSTFHLLEVVDVEVLLAELKSQSTSLSQDIKRNLGDFFDDIALEPEVLHFEGNDGFALRLRFRHYLRETVQFQQARAHLVSIDDAEQDIWLSASGAIEVNAGLNTAILETNTVASGAWNVDKIELVMDNRLRLVHDLQSRPNPNPSTVDESTTAVSGPIPDRRPIIFLYPTADAFNATISLSNQTHNDKPRELQIVLESGWNEPDVIDLMLRPTSAGLRLHLADAQCDGIEPRVEQAGRQGWLNLGTLKVHDSAVVKVPFTLEQQTKHISLRLEVRYQTGTTLSTFLGSAKLEASLPLDVDVDDTFHHDALYSTFTVRTTGAPPLLLTEAALLESAVYAVETPAALLPTPMLLFDKQPARLTFKITRKGTAMELKRKKDAALAVRLQYLSIQDALVARVCMIFGEDLKHTSMAHLARVLVPVLAGRCRKLWSAASSQAELVTATLTNNAHVPTFEDVCWNDLTRTLPSGTQAELSHWLLDWHSAHATISLKDVLEGEMTASCFTVSVDVPTIDIVHSTSLTLMGLPQRDGFATQILTLGQPVRLRLRIRHTDKWNATNTGRGEAKQTSALKFLYNIANDPEAWLVGGQRRAHFTVELDDEPQFFELVLIPLRLGLCALPDVDVQPAATEKDSGGAQIGWQVATSCETHNESAGQVVRVVRDLRHARAEILEDVAAGVDLVKQGTA